MFSRLNVRTKLLVMLLPAALGRLFPGLGRRVTAEGGDVATEEHHGSWTPTCDDQWEDAEATLDEQGKKGGDGPKGDDCHGGGGGHYPPAPIQITLPNPVIDYGGSLKAKGKGTIQRHRHAAAVTA